MPELLEKTQDQRIVLSGDWQHFKLLQKGYSEISRAKLSYYQGNTIERYGFRCTRIKTNGRSDEWAIEKLSE